jgi:hypothetical protein
VIDVPSLLDCLWQALREASKESFLNADSIASLAPILHVLVTVVQSRHPCRWLLMKQPKFWFYIQSIWTATMEKMEGAEVDGHVAVASEILDLVTCVLYDLSRGKHSDLQNDRHGEAESEAPLATIPEVGSSGALQSSAAIPTELWKLVADVYSPSSIFTSWLLQHGQSRHILAAYDQAEASLVETAQAAAVMVSLCNVPGSISCVVVMHVALHPSHLLYSCDDVHQHGQLLPGVAEG